MGVKEHLLTATTAIACSSGGAAAGVAEFTDKALWADAVQTYLTVDFTGFASGTFMTDQYAELGVIFTEANDSVVCCSVDAFPQDGAGLDGNGNITVEFETPQFWIAVDHPGSMQFQLFKSGELIHTSNIFFGGGVGNFAGLVSTEPFDSAVLTDLDSQVHIDDLHFGAPVPGPGALPILLAAGFLARRRRFEARAVKACTAHS